MSKKFPQDFETFYDDLLCELAKVSSINTMKEKKENRIKLEDRKIFVATGKSTPDFKEIPLKFIKTTYEELLKNNEVTQKHLSKTLYVKRSAFIICAFFLLEYVGYDENKNSIKVSNA